MCIFNTIQMDNFFPTQPLQVDCLQMRIAECGTHRQLLWGLPKQLKIRKTWTLPYHFCCRAANNWVASVLLMDSFPVSMMSTIQPLSGDDLIGLSMRNHPGNQSTNTIGINSKLHSTKTRKELDIPVIDDVFIPNKVVVEDSDQLRPTVIHSSYPDPIGIHFWIGLWSQPSSLILLSIEIFQQPNSVMWNTLTSLSPWFNPFYTLEVHQ